MFSLQTCRLSIARRCAVAAAAGGGRSLTSHASSRHAECVSSIRCVPARRVGVVERRPCDRLSAWMTEVVTSPEVLSECDSNQPEYRHASATCRKFSRPSGKDRSSGRRVFLIRPICTRRSAGKVSDVRPCWKTHLPTVERLHIGDV